MHPIFRQASYLTSAQKLSQAPPDEGHEVAFAGRSNAGKSSAINVITGIKALARTSKTPGRTQLLNFFRIDDDHGLVDLPGYGYAKVPERVKQEWQKTLSHYLLKRTCLHGLMLVMDVRHPLTDYDTQMLDWCQQTGMPVHILLTKADKLKRGPAKATLHQVEKALREADQQHASVQLFSAKDRTGTDEVHAVLNHWLGLD